jgi:hypothetical protein
VLLQGELVEELRPSPRCRRVCRTLSHGREASEEGVTDV